MTDWHHT